ncbi:MAG TPA: hypothetical protein VMW28_06110 [Pelolinea sp.]|nr:hypothetical protein [Pelolinea sp.]
MKSIKYLTLRVNSAVSRHRNLIVLVISIAMFILAAGAPNATIGIGK